MLSTRSSPSLTVSQPADRASSVGLGALAPCSILQRVGLVLPTPTRTLRMASPTKPGPNSASTLRILPR